MRKLSFVLFIITMSAISITPGLAQTKTERLTALTQQINPVINNWRYMTADVPAAQDPSFDDSNWKVGNPPLVWGLENVAWLRTKITIPDRIGGFPVEGTKVTLKVGVDDDGIIFVDGKEVQKFLWDKGTAVLTEKATPGQTFNIAIKGLSGPPPGRLLFAHLEFDGAADMAVTLQKFLGEYGYINVLQQAVEGSAKDRCTKALAEAEKAVDLDALDKADEKRFVDSLTTARQSLLSISDITKEQTIHLVGHAHIDMNWLWLWPETLQVCKDTFTSTVNFMQEFPDFRFSQSQAATYLAIEETYPDLFQKIKDAVKAGKWEITGGTWVEGDMNMASGESIVRQILYAKRYFMEKFGVEPKICWEPDTFGHAVTIPQILAKSGLKYYYFCRAGKGKTVFWWESPDGSRVLAYNDPGGYGATINDGITSRAIQMERDYHLKDSMIVYGVGDHGGGPTRADIENANELKERELFPIVKFSSAEEFFVAAESTKDLPVIKDELNFTFEGCYTTHADVKKWN